MSRLRQTNGVGKGRMLRRMRRRNSRASSRDAVSSMGGQIGSSVTAKRSHLGTKRKNGIGGIWTIPDSVEERIGAIYGRDGLSVKGRVVEATRTLLAERAARVKNPVFREQFLGDLEYIFDYTKFGETKIRTSKDLEQAIEALFEPLSPADDIPRTVAGYKRARRAARKRRIDAGTDRTMDLFSLKGLKWDGSSYFPMSGQINIGPRHRNIDPFGIVLSSIVGHEFEHAVLHRGGGSLFQRAVCASRVSLLNTFVNPLKIVTDGLAAWRGEKWAIAGEWEVLKRIPPSIRGEAIQWLEDSIELDAELLKRGGGRRLRKVIKDVYGPKGRGAMLEAASKVVYYRMLWLSSPELGLSKKEFVGRLAKSIGLNLWRTIAKPFIDDYRFARSEGYYSLFVARDLGIVLKWMVWAFAIAMLMDDDE